MRIFLNFLTVLALMVPSAWAGLPPTTSKASGDATNITTFNFQFPNFSVTHTGTTAAFNVNTVAGGGTGLSSLTPYALIVGGTTSTGNVQQVASLGSSGQALVSGGASALPTWASVLTNPMTTGGDVIYGGASGVPTRLANGSSGQILTSGGGTAAPTWSSALVSGTTATTQSAGDNSTSVATTAYSDGNCLGGRNQSYSNVTVSRAFATSYTNSTGRPIFVSVGANNSGTPSGATLSLLVGGVAVDQTAAGVFGGETAFLLSVRAIVPAGSTYQVNQSGLTLNYWYELR